MMNAQMIITDQYSIQAFSQAKIVMFKAIYLGIKPLAMSSNCIKIQMWQIRVSMTFQVLEILILMLNISWIPQSQKVYNTLKIRFLLMIDLMRAMYQIPVLTYSLIPILIVSSKIRLWSHSKNQVKAVLSLGKSGIPFITTKIMRPFSLIIHQPLIFNRLNNHLLMPSNSLSLSKRNHNFRRPSHL